MAQSSQVPIQSETNSDLFSPASKAEVEKRNEDRVKNCRHSWLESKLERIRLMDGWNQITIKDRCKVCRAEQKMILLVDENANPIKKHVSIRPWDDQDEEELQEERRRIEREIHYGGGYGPIRRA